MVYPPIQTPEASDIWNDVLINDTKYAKHPALVHDNPRIQEINEVISKQIEEMVLLVVRGFFLPSLTIQLELELLGTSGSVDHTNDTQVRRSFFFEGDVRFFYSYFRIEEYVVCISLIICSK